MAGALAVVAGIWQGYSLLELGRVVILPGRAGGLAIAAFVVAVAMWVLTLVFRHARGPAATDVAALTVLSVLLLAEPTTWVAGRYTVNVVVVVAGLRLSTRGAAGWCVPLLLVEAALLWRATAILPAGAGPGMQGAVLWPVYGAAIAAMAIFGSRALHRSAATVDEAHAGLVRERTAADVAAAVARDAEQQERLLHDTVLNTLTAVSRGGLDGATDRVRRRCADAADYLRALLRPPAPSRDGEPPPFAVLLADASDAVRETGATVAVTDATVRPVPDHVLDAIASAAGEALRNAARHAGARAVTVEARPSGSGIRVTISDDGSGFDVATVPPRFGITRSIRDAMRSCGGSAQIDSAPDRGTVVTLEWQPDAAAADPDHLSEDVERARAVVAPAVLLPFLALAWLSAAATWSEVVAPAATIGALLVYTVAVAYLMRAARGGVLGPRHVVAALAAAALIGWWSEVGLGGSFGTYGGDFSSWGTEAAASLLWTATSLGPGWALAPVLAMWLAVTGLNPSELVRPGGILLLAAALFAWSIRRQSHRYEEAVRATRAEKARRAAADESVSRRARRFGPLAWTALPLLDRLADGRADPSDPAVRHAARVEERFARSLVANDADSGPAAALAIRLATQARARSLVLETDVREPRTPPGDPAALERVERALARVIATLPTGDRDPRLTLAPENGSLVVRLVGPLPRDDSTGAPDLRFDALADEGLWEATVPCG